MKLIRRSRVTVAELSEPRQTVCDAACRADAILERARLRRLVALGRPL